MVIKRELDEMRRIHCAYHNFFTVELSDVAVAWTVAIICVIVNVI